MKISFKNFFKRSKLQKDDPAPGKVEGGRISRETTLQLLDRYQGEWTFLDPEIPANILEAIERFAIIIPDMSQHTKNIVNLGNTGHELEVVASKESVVEQAEDRLNMLARTIYPYGGTDGLVNKMLWDIAVFGAPSIEAVIAPDKKGVRKVVVVPQHEIRFKYDREQDDYIAHQKTGNAPEDYLELNPLTYYYAPLFQRRNSPYAIPPMLAALGPVLTQLYMLENVRFIVKKIGLLGLIHMILTKPGRKPQETEEQFIGRLKGYLTDVASDLTQHYRDGVMTTYDEFELKHFQVTGDVRGVKDLFQLNEEQASSGMGTDPAMLGRTYSTTETYSGVVYSKMIREIDNCRRITRRGVEKVYLLDLWLAGIPVEDVNLDFHPNAQLKPKEDAEIENLHATTRRDLYQGGIITLDEAREDLGYPPLETLQGSVQQIRAKFKFTGGKYVYRRPRIVLSNFVARLERIYKKVSMMSEESLENRRLDFVGEYLKEVLRIDTRTRDEIIGDLKEKARAGELPDDVERFVDEVYSAVERGYPIIARRQGVKEAISRNITSIYTFYRLSDTSLWGDQPPVKTKLDQPDRRAQDFLGRLDEIYFSEYVQNEPFKNRLTDFLRNEVIEKGLPATDAVLERFGTEWADNSELEVRRIVDTAVTRVRTFAHVRQMKQSGIKELEIVEIMDRITCGLCREEDGRIVRVALADEIVENALAMSPGQFRDRYITTPSTEREAMGTSIDDQVSEGKGLPPFHPACRGRTRSRFKKTLIEIEKEKGELDDIERHLDADYSDYGKKMTFDYTEKRIPREAPARHKTDQTLIYSVLNPQGKKVYLTREAIRHAQGGNPDDRQNRERALAIAGTVVASPGKIFVDKHKGNDTKVYLRHIRGIDYGVVTKRVGPEIIWTTFRYDGTPGAGWNEIWNAR